MPNTDDVLIPDRLADAVRRAAAAVPPGVGDLGAVRHRFLRRRRRRVALTTGLAALLVAGSGGLAPALSRETAAPGVPATPTAAATPTPPPKEPAQRLILPRGDLLNLRYAREGVPEVTADGRLTYHAVPEADVTGIVALPDGRLVLLHNYDKTPGVIEQPDGPYNPAVGYKLLVAGPDDTITYSRDVYIPGQRLDLLGATGTEAYLLRDAGVVAHAFGSGAERLVLPTRTVFPHGAGPGGLDIAAGRLATVDPNPCVIRVLELATGRRLADLRPPKLACGDPPAVLCTVGGLRGRSLSCFDTGEIRLSPDGSRLAVRHDVAAGRTVQTRLAVLDVATGAVLVDRVLATYADRATSIQRYPAIGWSDGRTVRMAVVTVPDMNMPHLVEDVLTVETIIVG